MYLITGIPRSGTSFLQRCFDLYGHSMSPKCYSDFVPRDPLTLAEPVAVARGISNGCNRHELIGIFDSIKSRAKGFSDGIPVMKTPQMVFRKPEIEYFDFVIVCLRSIDEGWLDSARFQNMPMWIYNMSNVAFLRPYANRINRSNDKLRELGLIWRQCSQEVIKSLDNSKVFIFDFDNAKESFGKLADRFSIGEEVFDSVWHRRRKK